MYIITRQTMENLAPPKTYHKFAMEFMGLPAGLGITSEQLCLRAQSVDKPSVSNEKTIIEQRGFVVNFSGKDVFSGQWQVTFYDTVDDLTRQGMFAWKDRACSLRTGASIDPALYKARCIATDLSYDNSELAPYDIKGIFPSEVAYTSAWGTDSSAQLLTVTFSYDYWENLRR